MDTRDGERIGEHSSSGKTSAIVGTDTRKGGGGGMSDSGGYVTALALNAENNTVITNTWGVSDLSRWGVDLG